MSAVMDPLVALLTDYRAQLAAFNALPDDIDCDEQTAATYGPLFDRLCTSPPAPTTQAGAHAGIEFVLGEMSNHSDSAANEAVLRVCADYLRQQGTANRCCGCRPKAVAFGSIPQHPGAE